MTAGRAAGEFLFHRDGTTWGKSHQQRPLADACRAANVSPAASFHVLRHTYASLMVMDAVPLMVVARNLGHADSRMVEKHYGHLATSYVREAIRAAKPLGHQRRGQHRPACRHAVRGKSGVRGTCSARRGIDPCTNRSPAQITVTTMVRPARTLAMVLA